METPSKSTGAEGVYSKRRTWRNKLVVTLKDPPTYPLDCVVLRNGEAICIVKHDNCKVPTTCIPDVVLTTEIELLASQFMTLCLMHRAMLKQGRDE